MLRLSRDIGWGDLSLTFDLDSVIIFSTVIFETYFSYDNDIWIAETVITSNKEVLFPCLFVVC